MTRRSRRWRKSSGSDVELKTYSIQAITEGEDALGEVVVRLYKDGHTVTGRGLSTNIIEASHIGVCQWHK